MTCSRVARFFERLTQSPEIPESALRMPTFDAQLSAAMRRAATDATQLDTRLDYSIESVAVVEEVLRQRPHRHELWRLGAYVGEVVQRNATGATWAWKPSRRRDLERPRQDAIVAIGRWITDPFEQIERQLSPQSPDGGLETYVRTVCAYASAPADETARALGLKTVFGQTNWDQIKEQWGRRRRRRWNA